MKTLHTVALILMQFLSAGARSCSTNDSLAPKAQYGFSLGLNDQTKSSIRPGFGIGIISDYRINKKLFFGPGMTLSFFRYSPGDVPVSSTVMEFPFHVSVKPCGEKLRPVISVGVNYKYDIGFRNSLGVFAEGALGLEKDLKYFTIVPELKYSYGKNMQAMYFTIGFKG